MAFMASPPRAVCPNRHMARPQGCDGGATRGQTAMGWCWGCPRPLSVNEEGERLAWPRTPGHVEERRPVSRLAQGLLGQLCRARGSLAPGLHEVLGTQGLALLTNVRHNMPNRLMRLWDTWLLRKRALMETINDQGKNTSQIAPTRQRSLPGFMVNLVAGLVAYSYRPKKPSLGLRHAPNLPRLRAC